MTDISAEDIAELRRQGDFGAFLELHLAAGKQVPAQKAAPVAAPRDPGHVPGAWPTGTQRPAANQPADPVLWQQALDDYRAWVADGEPDCDPDCQCTACQEVPR